MRRGSRGEKPTARCPDDGRRGAETAAARRSGRSRLGRKFDLRRVAANPPNKIDRDGVEFSARAAFPHGCDPPSRGLQARAHLCIPAHIAVELGSPELRSRGRRRRKAAPLVTVPETAMHEDCGAVFRQHDVGPARQAADIQSVPQAGRMKRTTDRPLGTRVAAANSGHHPRAGCGVDDVRHAAFFGLGCRPTQGT